MFHPAVGPSPRVHTPRGLEGDAVDTVWALNKEAFKGTQKEIVVDRRISLIVITTYHTAPNGVGSGEVALAHVVESRVGITNEVPVLVLRQDGSD